LYIVRGLIYCDGEAGLLFGFDVYVLLRKERLLTNFPQCGVSWFFSRIEKRILAEFSAELNGVLREPFNSFGEKSPSFRVGMKAVKPIPA
jgi:hypothetical protein